MGFIYKITNSINGKSYIGKTDYSVQDRFREHLSDSKKDRCKNRPLYKAIRKYGEDNFTVEVLEETENTAEREIFWIECLGTFSYGYNATKGGDGKRRIDWTSVFTFYLEYRETKSAKEIAEIFSIDTSSLLKYVRAKGFDTSVDTKRSRFKTKSVFSPSMNKHFNSVSEASIELVRLSNKQCSSQMYASHIAACCRGQRKSILGHTFQYSGEEESNRCPLEGCRHGALP